MIPQDPTDPWQVFEDPNSEIAQEIRAILAKKDPLTVWPDDPPEPHRGLTFAQVAIVIAVLCSVAVIALAGASHL